MKKVFIVHGFEGWPNGAWRPWLMAELEKKDVYACALAMQSPNKPLCKEWVGEIARQVQQNQKDQIYLVGHSLGVPAILHFLEKTEAKNVKGVVLVSGPVRSTKKALESFFTKPFDFKTIKSTVKKVLVIHGDNDPMVSLDQAETLSKELKGELVVIKNGKHLNGSAGFYTLPACLEGLVRVMK